MRYRVLSALGAVTAVVAAALAGLSVFWTGLWFRGCHVLGLWTGAVGVRYTGIGMSGTASEWHGPADDWCWIPVVTIRSSFIDVVLPLWCPFFVGLSLMAPVLMHVRRQGVGRRCGRCGYDLIGIPGGCPECGQEREA
jgi:hypothetical protein